MSSEIGIVGLGTMGANIARNFARNSIPVSVYNRSWSRTQKLIDLHDPNITGFHTTREMVGSLKSPRKILLMVTAESVDQVYKEFMPFLTPGDILIDGGNSHWRDTERRQAEILSTGVIFIGMGISGGEEGALNGPSIMFGGAKQAWDECQPILTPIAAKTPDGTPCVDYIGSGGSGHFVKMVHNAIEYADMQLIAETYSILTDIFHLTPDQAGALFGKWNKTLLQSYLIEITEYVLTRKEDGVPLVDIILDKAEQKGTGKWAAQDSFDLMTPAPAFAEAVAARMISFHKHQRVKASQIIDKQTIPDDLVPITIDDLESGLYAAKIACYAQGLALIQKASEVFNYGIDIAVCARIWRNGCIIRAEFLNEIALHYDVDTPNLMTTPHFVELMKPRISSWRKLVASCSIHGIPVPLYASTLSYFDAYSSERLPANLIQGLRDFFGAHTYERTDKSGHFHTNWET